MTFFLHRSPCGMTGPQKAYWENFSMMMTPLDYWKSGMDLWLRTAEAQMDMTFRMVSLMPSWEAGLLTARGLADDRVNLRPSKDGKPVLRSVVGTTPLTTARKPALKPVEAIAAPVVAAAVESAAEIRSAVAGAAEAQVEAAVEIGAAVSEVIEAQIEAAVAMAAPLAGDAGTTDATPAEALAGSVAEVQGAVAEAAAAQMDAAAKIADAVGGMIGMQAEAATIATAQVMDITGTAAEEVMAAMAETAAPYLADPGEIEPLAALPAEPAADMAAEMAAEPVLAPKPAPKPRTRRVAAAAVAEPLPSRKRRQPAKPKLPSAIKSDESPA